MAFARQIVLIALLFMPTTASAGGLSTLFEILAQRGAKTAAEIAAETGGRSSARIGRDILEDAAKSGLKGAEARQFNETIARMKLPSQPSQLEARLNALRSTLFSHGGTPLSHTAAFDDSLPFLRIRASGDPLIDEALVAYSRAKFEPVFAERFSTDDLRIIPLGMSEDVFASTNEIARYGRWIPRAQQDLVGPLSRLAKGELKVSDDDTMRRMLAPYRGQTIVFVGHIPKDTQAFFVMTPDGMKSIDLAAWMNVAKSAEVNIIPVGCHSGKFSPIGAATDINSDDVLKRLRNVIDRKPSTVLDFFKELSGDDLTLLLDPRDLQLFSNTIEIVRKETNEVVGNIVTNTGRAAVRGFSRSSSPQSAPSYALCFEQPDGDRFESCVRKTDADFKAASEAEKERGKQLREREIQTYRESRVEQLPSKINEAQKTANSAAFGLGRVALLYFLLWTVSLLSIPYASFLEREQRETGEAAWTLIASPRFNRKFARLFIDLKPEWRKYLARLSLLALPIFLLGPSVVLSGPYDSEFFPSAAIVGTLALAWICVLILWQSLQEECKGFALAPTIVIIWLASGYFYHQSSKPFWNAQREISSLKTELYAFTHEARNVWKSFLPARLWELN
jgi:hypothetical protein